MISGDATAPTLCVCNYGVENGDLREPAKWYELPTPNFNQAASAVTADCISGIKTLEGIA
jgi:hypothetical protein